MGNCPKPDCIEGPLDYSVLNSSCQYCPVIDKDGKFKWDFGCGYEDQASNLVSSYKPGEYIPMYKRYPGGKQPNFTETPPRWFCNGYNCTQDPDN
jgi:hypothetical protein